VVLEVQLQEETDEWAAVSGLAQRVNSGPADQLSLDGHTSAIALTG
jgi:hypothetical protein